MERMTLHRGLAELKLIDARILKGIEEMDPVAVYQFGKKINGHIELEKFKTAANAGLQSVTSLIERKGKIKSAIVKANGDTSVKVGEVEMTIADAINKKQAIELRKKLIDRLKKTYLTNVSKLNNANEQVNSNCQALLKAALGKDLDLKDTENKSQVEAIQVPYIKANEFHLHDPLDVQKKIQEMEKEIGDFEMEVDAALSEINSATFIEI